MMGNSYYDLGVVEPIVRVLDENCYTSPTIIQKRAIPFLLKNEDLLGIAQTGTGKTAAFALPILQALFESQCTPTPRSTRALMIAPTRELVMQIAENCKKYSRYLSLRQTSIYGGVKQKSQVQVMSRGVDLLIATPGRLLDLMNQGHIELSKVTHVVLDEADRMLDMGFIVDIKKIFSSIPKQRQTLLFSATMPETVSKLSKQLLNQPKVIEVTPERMTVEKIDQVLYKVSKNEKRLLLVRLLQDNRIYKAIVFSKTKHGANRILDNLQDCGISSEVIHGNKSQHARQKALAAFKKDKIRILVATDIAARGIDVNDITHVINYDLPNEVESYVHRIGRTARAGSTGSAISFCDQRESKLLRAIEKVIKYKIPVLKTPDLKALASDSYSPQVKHSGVEENLDGEKPKKIKHKRRRNPQKTKHSSGNGKTKLRKAKRSSDHANQKPRHKFGAAKRKHKTNQ